jgi:hypothetical protein
MKAWKLVSWRSLSATLEDSLDIEDVYQLHELFIDSYKLFNASDKYQTKLYIFINLSKIFYNKEDKTLYGISLLGLLVTW